LRKTSTELLNEARERAYDRMLKYKYYDYGYYNYLNYPLTYSDALYYASKYPYTFPSRVANYLNYYPYTWPTASLYYDYLYNRYPVYFYKSRALLDLAYPVYTSSYTRYLREKIHDDIIRSNARLYETRLKELEEIQDIKDSIARRSAARLAAIENDSCGFKTPTSRRINDSLLSTRASKYDDSVKRYSSGKVAYLNDKYFGRSNWEREIWCYLGLRSEALPWCFSLLNNILISFLVYILFMKITFSTFLWNVNMWECTN